MEIQIIEQRGMAMAAVKVGTSRQVVIPKKLYNELGLAPGDYLEVERQGSKLVLTPKELVEKHPEIDKRLAEAEADVRAGRVSGPFRTIEELTEHLNAQE